MQSKSLEEEGEELFPAEGENEEAERAEGEGEPGQGSQPEEEEVRKVRSPIIPNTPSREEVRLHRLTHRPFRSWCPHCIRGKGRASPHLPSSQKGTESDVPKLVADYFFIGRRRPADRAE